jgi:hypothetical protein
MSGQGSGSGGPRRSDRLAKGKAIAYEPESPPDTDDEYDAMEDVRTRADASIARNLQAELDAEAVGLSSGATRPSSRPGLPTHLASLLRLRQLLLLPDRRGRDPTALLFPRILYQRIMLHRGSGILPMVAFDRVIPSPLRWRIRHS